MTNNERFKTEATKLLAQLIDFRGFRIPGICDKDGSLAKLERDLRGLLHILRTDEENYEQANQDRMC
jgi:hypothetical protein